MISKKGVVRPTIAVKVNAVVDLLLLVGSAMIAAGLGERHFAFHHSLLWSAAVGVAVWFISATALRHYDPSAYNRPTSDDASLVTVLVFAVVTVLFLLELCGLHGHGHLFRYLLSLFPSVLAVRMIARALSEREGHVEDVLIIGIGPIGRLSGVDLAKRGRHRVRGHLNFSEESDNDAALLRRAVPNPVQLGTVADLESVLRTTPVNEVYIAGNLRKHSAEMQACIHICERLGVPFALPASGFRLDRARALDSHGVSDGYLHYLSVSPKPNQAMIKRLFDIGASAAALWILLPLFLLVAAAIKLTSRGPILFKQVRTGLYGSNFHMLKFRSMVANAERLRPKLELLNDQTGPVFKMKKDPRITAVGRFIRKYSIDELPQLINVLRGDMSVVGPRPPIPSEVAKYEAWQVRRLSVRPGLTCIWQVSGRSQISFEEWIYLDLQYIDHWSLMKDFSLIFKTVPAVLTGKGAS